MRNPHLTRPDLDPPRTPSDIHTVPPAGRKIQLRFGQQNVVCTVEKAHGLEFRVRVISDPPKGRKWQLRAFQVGDHLTWGPVTYKIAGRTGVALRLRKEAT
jgi:hypothetical protein